jgi:hypothetical protein
MKFFKMTNLHQSWNLFVTISAVSIISLKYAFILKTWFYTDEYDEIKQNDLSMKDTRYTRDYLLQLLCIFVGALQKLVMNSDQIW